MGQGRGKNIGNCKNHASVPRLLARIGALGRWEPKGTLLKSMMYSFFFPNVALELNENVPLMCYPPSLKCFLSMEDGSIVGSCDYPSQRGKNNASINY